MLSDEVRKGLDTDYDARSSQKWNAVEGRKCQVGFLICDLWYLEIPRWVLSPRCPCTTRPIRQNNRFIPRQLD